MKNIVVVAGAGTGKTHTLVENYLRALLEGPRSPDRLLAITFTDKAASEMRARVQRRLGDLRFNPDVEPELASINTLPPSALDGLRRAVTGAPIQTFHAFCARVLRDFALAADVDPSFALLEPDDERRLLQETAEAVVIDALQRGDPQAAELSARIALRGFGDRKGLVECLVDVHDSLAEQGLSASALPLANRSDTPVAHALQQLNEKLAILRAKVGEPRPGPSPGAGMRVAQLTDAANAVAFAWFTPTDDPEAFISSAFTTLRAHAGGSWGGPKVTEERRAVVDAVDALGAALIDAFVGSLFPVARAMLVELDARVAQEKHARGVMGFGDLLLATRRLLRDDGGVRARLKARFDRIFVDEYQDTSPVQEDILGLLIEEPSKADIIPDDARALDVLQAYPGRAFLVGDPKQSIYGFRGADATVFTRALERIADARDGLRKHLAESRRSTPAVVELANVVATHALMRGQFGVDKDAVVPLSALRESAGPTAGEHWIVAPRADDAPALPPHELESLVVARRLRDMIDNGETKPGHVAILVRRAKAAVPLQRALGRAGIGSVIAGGDGFWSRPEVIDVVSALILAADPSDELAVLTVLRSPLVAVPDDQILALYEVAAGKRMTWTTLVELTAGGEPPPDEAGGSVRRDVRERVRAFDAVLSSVRRKLHHEPLARAVDVILDDAGYATACALESDAALRAANLEKLRARCARVRESALVQLARFAEALDDPPPEPMASVPVDDELDAVRIMTIHQAKGLEFPVVIIADAGSGLRGETDDVGFDSELGLAVTARGRPIAACAQKSRGPGRQPALTAIQRVRRRLRDRAEAELARLLYVALTRARDRVFLVGTPRRSGAGSLAGLFDIVRAADTARVDALLPRIEVAAEPVFATKPPVAHHDDIPAADASLPLERVTRIRASELHARASAQSGFVLSSTASRDGDLDPLAAGQLAHAIVALVASELPDDVRAGGDALTNAVLRAARANGALDPPSDLCARCVKTLHGPVRALLDDGYALSFEEMLWLERGGCVVEGRADLIGRRPDRTVVAELKLTPARADHESTKLQLAAYALALEELGAPAVHVTAWALGDADPRPARKLSAALREKLDETLARIR